MRRDEDPDDPVIVFGEYNDEDQVTPIGIGVRQPSFTQLQGTPIPKGFESIADMRAEKPPVKVEPFSCHTIPESAVEELLQNRNARKWLEMGYDPDAMNMAVHRNGTQTTFKDTINIANTGVMASSFSTIDAWGINEKPNIMLESINEEDNCHEHRLMRCLSNGAKLPTQKSNRKEIHVSDFEIDYLREVPEQIRNLTFHPSDSLPIKALAGYMVGKLPDPVYDALLNDLESYIEMAVCDDLIGEACYIQVAIERVKCDNQRDPVMPNSELEYRIEDINAEITDTMAEFASREEKLREEKCDQIQRLERHFSLSLNSLDRQLKYLTRDYTRKAGELKSKLQEQKSAVVATYDAKMAALLKQRDDTMRPLFHRLITLRQKHHEVSLDRQLPNTNFSQPRSFSSRISRPMAQPARSRLAMLGAAQQVRDMAVRAKTPARNARLVETFSDY